jgi:hypothetical protein
VVAADVGAVENASIDAAGLVCERERGDEDDFEIDIDIDTDVDTDTDYDLHVE